ncbi:mas-related G-protein coupled receptor member D-like [Paroedura picta]|uniref:mas-related G-protein coupled receptor member D-like n=1 Tax=Paroedura picta TaxID=143630 RepID=UPI004055F4F6
MRHALVLSWSEIFRQSDASILRFQHKIPGQVGIPLLTCDSIQKPSISILLSSFPEQNARPIWNSTSQRRLVICDCTQVCWPKKSRNRPLKPKLTMIDAFNLKALFPRLEWKYSLKYYILGDEIILSVFTILSCIVGLVGNGNVIWLLGFQIKRKPFATYALNLAIAEFGTLVSLLPLNIHANPPTVFEFNLPPLVLALLTSHFILMYSNHQLLLTAISIDRWVFVLFPNWYQGHRSPLLFTTVCGFIWALSFAILGMSLLYLKQDYYGSVLLLGLIVITCLCFFLVFISTLTLFIRVCLKSQWCQCGNLLKVILLMLLSFLLFTILTYACSFMTPHNSLVWFLFWTSLKNNINPLIYLLAGRQNDCRFQERMKVILQRVFKEERDPEMELQPHTQTIL